MKKIIALILVSVLCLSVFSACSKDTSSNTEPSETQNSEPVVLNDPLCDGKTLKVLAIGNSFSNDTTEYLYDIAVAHGMTDVVIGRLYYGACTVQQHATYAKNNKTVYDYYKNTFGYWDKVTGVNMLHGLEDENWDIITLQQASGTSGVAESYDGCLEELIMYVNEHKTNPNAKLVWNMTWAYQGNSTHKDFERYGNRQDQMYRAITDVVQNVILPMDVFAVTIPAGTAIQNARTGKFGDTLTIDGHHLNTLGKVITAYTWFGIFTGKLLDSIDLDTAGITPLTTDEKTLILNSVNSALEKPYEITDISEIVK